MDIMPQFYDAADVNLSDDGQFLDQSKSCGPSHRSTDHLQAMPYRVHTARDV